MIADKLRSYGATRAQDGPLRRTSRAQGPEQSHGKLSPADKATRTDHEAIQSALDLDLVSDLDHLVVGQVEIIAHPGGVADHRGEQGLLPVWNTLAVLGGNDCHGADIIGHVGNVDLRPFRAAVGQNLGNIRVLHETDLYF